MKGLIAAHSGMRYIVLLFILVAIINAARKLKATNYTKKDNLINLLTMVFLHIQLLLGMILYIKSPKVQFAKEMMKETTLRFFTMEHVLIMVIAITLITLGKMKAGKLEDPAAKHQIIFKYYGLGLIILFVGIPWPFLYNVGAQYF
ncbi:MAG: cytochrome B [Brumimicrobium sp.]|nr:cytochrome B [Brumimicrobium sp.]